MIFPIKNMTKRKVFICIFLMYYHGTRRTRTCFPKFWCDILLWFPFWYVQRFCGSIKIITCKVFAAFFWILYIFFILAVLGAFFSKKWFSEHPKIFTCYFFIACNAFFQEILFRFLIKFINYVSLFFVCFYAFFGILQI